MPSAAVVSAVAARLGAGFARCPIIAPNRLPVDDAGVPSDEAGAPLLDRPWVTYDFPSAGEVQISIGAPGDNVFREEGAFRIVLAWPSGESLDQAWVWLDEIRALFRGKTFAGVVTWAPSAGVLDDRGYDGLHVLLATAIPYYHDLRG